MTTQINLLMEAYIVFHCSSSQFFCLFWKGRPMLHHIINLQTLQQFEAHPQAPRGQATTTARGLSEAFLADFKQHQQTKLTNLNLIVLVSIFISLHQIGRQECPEQQAQRSLLQILKGLTQWGAQYQPSLHPYASL